MLFSGAVLAARQLPSDIPVTVTGDALAATAAVVPEVLKSTTLFLPQEAALLQPQPVELNSSELEADMEQGTDDDTADSDITPAPAPADQALSSLPAFSTHFTTDDALAPDQDPTAAANAALDTQQQAEEAEQAVADLSELPIAGASDLDAALTEQAECIRQPKDGVEYNKVHLPDLHIEFEIRCVRL